MIITPMVCQNVLRKSNSKMMSQPLKQNLHSPATQLHRAVAALCLLLCAPLAVQALSLGRTRGAVLLGQPLNVSVAATVDAQEETPEAACFSAEVFYGDNRQSAQNVALSVARSSPTELTLRVRASGIVDEPVVTVYVKAGCAQSSSRRYVLLPDAPSEPALAGVFSPPVNIPLGPATSAKTRPAVTPQAGESVPGSAGDTSTGKSSSAERRTERARLRAQRSAQPAPAQQQTAQLKPAKPAARLVAPDATSTAAKPLSKSRLKLDLLDLTSPVEPSLRASSELLTQPTADAGARAQAALIWRAINAKPEDVLRDAARLQSIEAEVRGMQDVTKRQTQELSTLKSDLVRAQQERYANPLVYLLGLLALVALGGAIYFYRLGRRLNSPWWGSNSKFDANADGRRADRARPQAMRTGSGSQADGTASGQSAEPTGWQAVAGATMQAQSAGMLSGAYKLPGNLDGAGKQRTAETTDGRRAALRESVVSDFEPNMPGTVRAVNAEELFDIQQQADFFLSLGQHAQAIDILKNHISENVETSALAYLDLFSIYHQVGQRDEFEDLRGDFNMVFNAQVPSFDDYGHSSRGLEQYQAAMSRIQELWPSPKVLEVIEESIFRKPELDGQPFELTAYRELMLLYAMAKDIIDQGNYESHEMIDLSAGYTEMQPLSGLVSDPPAFAPSQTASHLITQPLQPIAQDTVQTGVDIELDIFDDSLFDKPTASLPTPASPARTPPVHDSGSIDFDEATSSEFGRLKGMDKKG